MSDLWPHTMTPRGRVSAIRPEERVLVRKPYSPIVLAALVSCPGVVVALAHVELSAPLTAFVAGLSILTAAFILVWACDAAQADISQSLALAVVAVVAVLPEYAVDMYFTWQAGKFPDSDNAQYAIANMTGANRLIIGVAWAVVAIIFWVKTRRAVRLEEDRLLEIRFLAMATLYAFLVPIKGNLAWYDGIVFIGLYVWYIVIAGRRPQSEVEAEGPGAYLAGLPPVTRRVWTILLFIFAAAVIVMNAEHFCEGLVATGKVLGISEFLLVQWLAPLASEAPEFVVAIMFALRARAGLALGSLLSAKLNQWTLLVGAIPWVFALRARAGLALGSLVSAKLNQWTLLVGAIPWVYALSSGTLAHPLPMGRFQMEEILLTAAQSLLAVVMLATLRLSVAQGLLLFAMFAGQLVAPAIVESCFGGTLMGIRGDQMHVFFSFLYVIAAIALIVDHPQRLAHVLPWLQKRSRE